MDSTISDGLQLSSTLTTGNATWDKTLEKVGFLYDPKQDIFISRMDAWQRNYGYFRLYDEMLAPLNMIVDCEPIYFHYNDKRWLIQLWKGQYALTLGCEIGIYYTDQPDIHIPNLFSGPFFQCAEDEDLLQMAYTLYKNEEILFTRADHHWWLTGFILGKYADPEDLSMEVSITLKDEIMLTAFMEGLKDAGYHEDELNTSKYTVSLTFAKPHTPQPSTRTPETDAIVQWRNQLLCEIYQNLTQGSSSIVEKMATINEMSPALYKQVMHIGKAKQLYLKYNRNLLNK